MSTNPSLKWQPHTVERIAFVGGALLGFLALAGAVVLPLVLVLRFAPEVIDAIHWGAEWLRDVTGAPTLPITEHRSITA